MYADVTADAYTLTYHVTLTSLTKINNTNNTRQTGFGRWVNFSTLSDITE